MFTDSGLAIGGATSYDNYAVALGDVDGDGYLDAFAGGGTNKLWINDPDFRFTSGVVTVGTSTFLDDLNIIGDSISVTGLDAGANDVSLIARAGAITDGGGTTDVTANAVKLDAADGVGTAGAALDTAR